MLKTTLLHVATSVFLLILGSIIGIFSERYKVESNERIRSLESEVSISTQLLTPPSLLKGVVAITVDGEAVDGMSSAVIRVYNRSDRDFEQIPIYLELVPTKSTSPPVTVIGSEVYGASGLKDGIVPIDQVSPSAIPGARRLGYTIRNANRNKEPILVARFILVGREISKVNVSIDKKGLDLVGYGVYDRADFPVDKYLGFAYAVLVLAVATWLLPKAEAWSTRREIARLRTVLPAALEEHGVPKDATSSTMEQIIDLLLTNRRQATPRLLRWIIPKPSADTDRSQPKVPSQSA